MIDDTDEFMDAFGITAETKVPNILKPWMQEHNFELVQSIEKVREIVTKAIESGFCSLDLETEGLDNRIVYKEDGTMETVHKIVGACICYDQKIGYYIPMRHIIEDGVNPNVQPLAEVEKELARLCHASIPKGDPDSIAEDPLSYQKHEKPQVVIAFWNGKFDQEFLLPITGMHWWHPASWEDGNLACYCIYSGDNSLSLKDKAKQLLKDSRGNPYEMIKLKELFNGKARDIKFAQLDPTQPAVVRYGGSDAICTYMLCRRREIIERCHTRHAYTYRLEKQVAQVMRTMERNRVKIDREKIRGMLKEQEDLREAILQRIKDFAKANGKPDLDPASPKQLGEFLFEPAPIGINIFPKPPRNEASNQYKTDAATLEELAKDPNAPTILKDVVSFREAEKFITTYLLSLANNPDENDEIRVQFKQTGASSGRFSAPAGEADQGFSGVPIHGIPGTSEVRRAFVSRKGYTKVKADFAAEELRIASNVSGETVWIEEFLHGSGDLHSITARAFFGKQEVSKEERGMGKTANFALLYGGGPQAIMRAVPGCDPMEARRKKDAFDKSVPKFSEWLKQQKDRVKKDLGVWTAFGRWLAIPDAAVQAGQELYGKTLTPEDAKKIRSACERYATNYPIQGAGADIMKIALVLLHKKFRSLGWLREGGDDSVRMELTVHDEIVFEIRDDRVIEAIPYIVDIMESPWKMPKSPKWQVPLVVEPLIGYNWKSGFSAERAKEKRHGLKPEDIVTTVDGIPLKKGEVLANGFIYSCLRKPSEGEALDIGEVKEGKMFRVINPTWLGELKPHGYDGSPVIMESSSEHIPSESVEDIAVPEISEMLPPALEAPTMQSQEANSAVTWQPLPVATEVNLKGVLHVRLLQLPERATDQVLTACLLFGDNENGRTLVITDPAGAILVNSEGKFKVDEKPFIEYLLERSLIDPHQN